MDIPNGQTSEGLLSLFDSAPLNRRYWTFPSGRDLLLPASLTGLVRFQYEATFFVPVVSPGSCCSVERGLFHGSLKNVVVFFSRRRRGLRSRDADRVAQFRQD